MQPLFSPLLLPLFLYVRVRLDWWPPTQGLVSPSSGSEMLESAVALHHHSSWQQPSKLPQVPSKVSHTLCWKNDANLTLLQLFLPISGSLSLSSCLQSTLFFSSFWLLIWGLQSFLVSLQAKCWSWCFISDIELEVFFCFLELMISRIFSILSLTSHDPSTVWSNTFSFGYSERQTSFSFPLYVYISSYFLSSVWLDFVEK